MQREKAVSLIPLEQIHLEVTTFAPSLIKLPWGNLPKAFVPMV